MYRDGSDTAPLRNDTWAKCEICANSVHPGAGYVTNREFGFNGRVWIEVHCKMCFTGNYPLSSIKYMTQDELRAAQLDFDTWYAETH